MPSRRVLSFGRIIGSENLPPKVNPITVCFIVFEHMLQSGAWYPGGDDSSIVLFWFILSGFGMVPGEATRDSAHKTEWFLALAVRCGKAGLADTLFHSTLIDRSFKEVKSVFLH